MKWTRKYEALRLILAVLVCAAIPAVSMAESDGNPVEKFPPPCADSLQCDDNQVIAETFALYYWRDRIDLDETYLDNGWQMARIRDYLARSPRIDSITIFAYASPEGAYRRRAAGKSGEGIPAGASSRQLGARSRGYSAAPDA